MTWNDDGPIGHKWVGPAVPAVLGAYFCASRASHTNVNVDLWWGVLLVSAVLGFWALVAFFEREASLMVDLSAEWQRVKYRLSEGFKMEVLAKMTPEQVHAYERMGTPIIDVVGTERGRVDILHGEPVYLYFMWYFLKHSTDTHLMKISDFKEETYHYDIEMLRRWDDVTQARAATLWLVNRKFAEYGTSNQPARWTSKYARAKAMEWLGLSEDDYDSPLPELV
jgi:hypothetical protein